MGLFQIYIKIHKYMYTQYTYKQREKEREILYKTA
jgi:hypothetical protein